MTSPQEETTIIEHIVLFKTKDDNDDDNDNDNDNEGQDEDYSSKVNDMVNELNALSTLDSVVYLTAGPIVRTRSEFTHMLHARYRTVSDLHDYAVHPAHVAVVDNFVLPLCDDVMAVDWSANLGDGDDNISPVLIPRPGSAIRVTFLKVEGEKEEEEFLEGIREIKQSMGPYEQISYGKNFSDRGKGYNVATLVIFPDLNELDASEDYEDQMRSLVHKFKDSNDEIIAVDYVVPRTANVKSNTEE